MYDINSFSSSALKDIMATHPYVIKDGKISKNQFYVDPMALLSSVERDDCNPLEATTA